MNPLPALSDLNPAFLRQLPGHGLHLRHQLAPRLVLVVFASATVSGLTG